MRSACCVLVALTLLALPCGAGLPTQACSNCGCCQLQKVCRRVPDVKKVTETKFVAECEEFCVPGKSRCEEQVVADASAPGGQRCETVTVPTCGRVYTRTKLKKVTTTTEKMTYKCVVDTVCSQCGQSCGSGTCGK